MKQKDILLIGIVIMFSVIFSAVISNLIFSSSQSHQQKVEVVQPISADFPTPTKNDPYFNAQAIDPTQLITIGNNNNPVPFNTPPTH